MFLELQVNVSVTLKYPFGPSMCMAEQLVIGLFCVLPVAVTGSPNLLCCILRYFIDFAFCCCAI